MLIFELFSDDSANLKMLHSWFLLQKYVYSCIYSLHLQEMCHIVICIVIWIWNEIEMKMTDVRIWDFGHIVQPSLKVTGQ